MSPIFSLKKNISTKDLVALEKYFATTKNQAQGPFENHSPRLAVFEDSYYNLQSIDRRMQKQGWQKHSGAYWLNVWKQPLPVKIPKGFYFKAGPYFEKALYKDFRKMMRENFGTSLKFLRELDKMHRLIQDQLRSVVIYNSKSQPVGAGLVATGSKGSFLYCGSINKKYRRKGLWKLLVAARQSISNSGPDHMWATSTFNPNIFEKGDLSRKIVFYHKSE